MGDFSYKLEIGEKVSITHFHVSETNVRYGKLFGDSVEDQNMIRNIKRSGIVQPFKVRPEGNDFGVVNGRRRFLAKKVAGAVELVYGLDFVLEEMDENVATEQSLTENLKILQKSMDPITRAENLRKIIVSSKTSLRATGRRLGIPVSTLSEWLKILELSEKMQKTVQNGLLFFKEALKFARLNLPLNIQNNLAEILENKGVEAFHNASERYIEKKLKRGIPEGKYMVSRIVWNKVQKGETEIYAKLEQLAKEHNIKTEEYVKKIVTEYIKQKT